MATSIEQPEPAPNAEQCFRDAFERLKHGVPQVLPKGARVSQNNVAKEAQRPGGLHKSRYPLLVLAIQEWIKAHKGEELPSKRQRLLDQRRKNRTKRKIIADLKKQRNFAVGLLADADLRIVQLTEKVADLQTRLDQIRPAATILDLKN